MATKESSVKTPDSQLAVEMLKRKLVNESQLKAAIDYQESLGGRLLDILLKLGLVGKDSIETFLRQLLRDEPSSVGGASESSVHVDPEKLKVHRKLLEKIPASTVEEHQLLLFFPPPGTRAILLSAAQKPSEELRQNLQTLLGVELYPIEVEAEVRARFLPGDGSPPRAAKKKPAASHAAGTSDAGSGDDHPVLRALVNLLDRKEIVLKEELRVEVELLRRRSDS
jgi:hypothetical protein